MGVMRFLGYIIFKALYGAKDKKIPSFILNLVKVITNNLSVSETYLSNSFKIKKIFSRYKFRYSKFNTCGWHH